MRKTILLFITLCLAVSKTSYSQTCLPGKRFNYDVTYFQKKNGKTSHETVSLLVTGKIWQWDNKQMEAIWQYGTSEDTKRNFQASNKLGWIQADTTGFIDDSIQLWIHPPRHNQYGMTEIAPFPMFMKGHVIGYTYGKLLKIGTGWGDWSGKQIEFNYTIVDSTKEKNDTIWRIEAKSQFDSLENSCIFIYSEINGFILMDYTFYNGDTLNLKLIPE